MKYSLLLSCLFNLFILGCSDKSPNLCNTQYPFNEFHPIDEEYHDTGHDFDLYPCECSIIQAIYYSSGSAKGITVFYESFSGPLCDTCFCTTLYDCSGNALQSFSYEDIEAFQKTVIAQKILHRCIDE